MRVGIITDIHEDYERLSESFRLLEKKQCDEIVCLGDITGFDVRHYKHLSGRNASKCIESVKDHCKYVLAGNHDWFTARRIPAQCGLFPFPENWYDLDYSERYRLGYGRVWLYEDHDLSSLTSRSETDYLKTLPESVMTEYNGMRVLFSHSVMPDLSGSAVWRPRKPEDFSGHFRFMNNQRCRIGISGHFHPAGAELAMLDYYGYRSFGAFPFPDGDFQIIMPCVAAASGYNGCAIMDFKSLTAELIPLKTKKHYFRRFV